MDKHSVKIAGHATSISLEKEFWAELKKFAAEDGLSLNALVERVDSVRTKSNLCSALRVYVLERVKGNSN